MTRTFLTKVKATPSGDGLFTFIGSTPKVDRAGDSIKPVWDLTSYTRNPVFLYQHDHEGLPIGKAENVYLDGDALKFDIRFVPEDIYPFAGTVRKMYEGGWMSAVSVGFRPLAAQPNNEGGMDFEASELLELSAVSVPCNTDALMAGKGAVLPVFKGAIEAALKDVDAAKVKEWMEAPASVAAAPPPVEAVPEATSAEAPTETPTVPTEEEPMEPNYHDAATLEATPEALADMLTEAAVAVNAQDLETAKTAIVCAFGIMTELFPTKDATSETVTKSEKPEQDKRPAETSTDKAHQEEEIEASEEDIDALIQKIIGDK
jgi:HK97 family phage prohead protease